jgi:hypothetical protein
MITFSETELRVTLFCNLLVSTAVASPASWRLFLDEETRVMILKKTWCHGQLVLPALAVWYFSLAIFSDASGNRIDQAVLIYAGIVLPCWSYYSYHTILATSATNGRADSSSSSSSLSYFMDSSTSSLYIGGVMVQSAHAGVLWRAVQGTLSKSSTTNMIIMIISGLLLIETAAFLLVMHMFGRTRRATEGRNNSDEPYQQYQDL